MAKKNMMKAEIGDGKTPNKYWVIGSNDYTIAKRGVATYASEKKGFPYKETTKKKQFDSYTKAKNYVEEHNYNIYDGSSPKKDETNSIIIEDRLSGVIYEENLEVFKSKDKNELEPITKVYASRHEDIGFTQKELEKRGMKFK